MQVSLRYWFAFLWIYPAELGSLDHMVVLFLIFWGNIYTVFYSSCTILHSQQCTRIPFSLHLHWHLLSRLDESHSDRCKVISPCGFDCCLVLMRAILAVVRWYLLVDLICIFLISIILNIFSYTCCPFVCLLLIIVYSFVHFSNSAFLLSYRSSLYVLDITSSLGTVGRHSKPSCRPAAHSLHYSSCSCWTCFPLFTFTFAACAFWCHIQKEKRYYQDECQGYYLHFLLRISKIEVI